VHRVHVTAIGLPSIAEVCTRRTDGRVNGGIGPDSGPNEPLDRRYVHAMHAPEAGGFLGHRYAP
jgi:hypothetical protein